MAIHIYNGLPGAGKTTKLASIALALLRRHKRQFRRTGVKRQVISNMKFSPIVERDFAGFITYWTDIEDMVKYRQCDVIIDEVATYFDSTQWANTPMSVKRYLQQHRHFGIDIYGSTQDFAMVDIAMRRLVKRAYWVTKMIGSPDISTTRPPVKHPWGVIMLREIEWKSFRDDAQEYKFKLIPSLLFISKELTSAFDTTEELKSGEFPALKHITRKCTDCGFIKVVHL